MGASAKTNENVNESFQLLIDLINSDDIPSKIERKFADTSKKFSNSFVDPPPGTIIGGS